MNYIAKNEVISFGFFFFLGRKEGRVRGKNRPRDAQWNTHTFYGYQSLAEAWTPGARPPN